MTSTLPWSLIAAFGLTFGFVNAHQRCARDLREARNSYARALHISLLIGLVVVFSLLLYYWCVTSWYSALVLYLSAVTVSAFGFRFVERELSGRSFLSLLGFVAWPVCATVTFVIVSKLHY